MKLRSFSSCY